MSPKSGLDHPGEGVQMAVPGSANTQALKPTTEATHPMLRPELQTREPQLQNLTKRNAVVQSVDPEPQAITQHPYPAEAPKSSWGAQQRLHSPV